MHINIGRSILFEKGILITYFDKIFTIRSIKEKRRVDLSHLFWFCVPLPDVADGSVQTNAHVQNFLNVLLFLNRFQLPLAEPSLYHSDGNFLC